MVASPNHQASSQDQPQQQPNDHNLDILGKATTDAASGALKAASDAVTTTAGKGLAGVRAAILGGVRKSIFNCIKMLGRGAWALIKKPVKAFLSKLLLIILAIVLIRLMLPYFISSIGYLIAKLLRWFFSPFYGIHDNISNAIQALGHGAVSVGHGIAHGTSFVGHGLGGGARALGHGAAGIGHGIAHGASFMGHGLGHGARALGHGAVGIGHGIAHGASFVGHGLGHGARALGHGITHDISPAVHEVGRAIFGF